VRAGRLATLPGTGVLPVKKAPKPRRPTTAGADPGRSGHGHGQAEPGAAPAAAHRPQAGARHRPAESPPVGPCLPGYKEGTRVGQPAIGRSERRIIAAEASRSSLRHYERSLSCLRLRVASLRFCRSYRPGHELTGLYVEWGTGGRGVGDGGRLNVTSDGRPVRKRLSWRSFATELAAAAWGNDVLRGARRPRPCDVRRAVLRLSPPLPALRPSRLGAGTASQAGATEALRGPSSRPERPWRPGRPRDHGRRGSRGGRGSPERGWGRNHPWSSWSPTTPGRRLPGGRRILWPFVECLLGLRHLGRGSSRCWSRGPGTHRVLSEGRRMWTFCGRAGQAQAGVRIVHAHDADDERTLTLVGAYGGGVTCSSTAYMWKPTCGSSPDWWSLHLRGSRGAAQRASVRVGRTHRP